MLATLAALQLLTVTQGAAPSPFDRPFGVAEARALSADAPGSEAIPPPPPPPAGERPEDSARAGGAVAQAPGEARGAEQGAAAPATPRQRSLLSGESLRGGSAALAWAGWPSLGAAYAIGFTERDDAGFFLDYDWAKTETRIGVLYRRALAPTAALAVAARLGVAWYEDFGAKYFYDKNHSDRGIDLAPGVSVSSAGAGGIFSVLAEAPMTVTTKHKNGFLFSPRVSLAFEAPLYESVTLGARAGAGYRAGAGGAPIREGRGELLFLVLAGYQFL